MSVLKRSFFVICLAATICCPSIVNAGAFTPGNLVVVRAGDGTAALTNGATATFLDEYTTGGSLVQSIALPTTVSGANRILTLSGTATSEGYLSMSADGRYLLLAGFDAPIPTTGVASTASATIGRVIGRVDLTGNVNTTTASGATGVSFTGTDIRGATSLDGYTLWASGTAAPGSVYATLGTNNWVQLATTPLNFRNLSLFSNQLYVATAAGSRGVNTIGSGLPITGSQTVTNLNGMTTADSSGQANDFVFASSTVVYVADDRTTASGGGIKKWTLSSGTWGLTSTIATGLTNGCRGVTMVPGSSPPILYATTAETTQRVVTVTDTGATPTFSAVASVGTNKAFRGLRYLPKNDCGTITLDGIADTAYGSAISVQTSQTGYGNSTNGSVGCANGSELDQAFGVIRGGTLYLTLAGNLESSGNQLIIFFDSATGGQSSLRGDNDGGATIAHLGFGGGNLNLNSPVPNGMTFDSGFAPDYAIGVNLSCFTLFADYFTLPTSSGGTKTFLGSTSSAGGDGTLSGGTNPNGIKVTINNANVGGVTDIGIGTPTSAVTGLELAIPLAALGLPSGSVNVCALITNSIYDNLSNQVLGPLPTGGTGYTHGAYRNFITDPDASGNQFFTVPVGETSPTISVQPSNASACVGGNASFSVTASGAGTLTYQWRRNTTNLTNGVNGNGTTISGATTATLSLTNLHSGDAGNDYNCVVTNSCGSATSNNATLTVQSAPTASAGGPYSTCNTSTVNISGTASNASGTTWSSSGTGVFGNPSVLSTNYTPSAADVIAGSVTLTLTASATSPCSTNATSNATLTIQKNPTASAGGPYSTCQTSVVNITGTAANSGSTTWTTSGSGTFGNANALSTTYTPSGADVTAGSVTLTLTSTAISPCSANATSNATLTIQQAPTASAGGPYSTCATAPVSLTGSASNQSSVSWSTSGTGSFTNGNTVNDTYTPSLADVTAGSVTLTLTANATSPCSTPATTSNATLTIQKNPTASAGGAYNTCEMAAVNISGSATDYSSILWTTSGSGNFGNASALSTTYTPSGADVSAGSVTLTLTANAISPCTTAAASQATLTIVSNPTASSGGPYSSCDIALVNISGSATNQSSVLWTTSGSGSFGNASSLSTTYAPSGADIIAGSVTLTLTANAASPCTTAAVSQATLTIKRNPTASAGGPYGTCDLAPVNISGSSSDQSSITWSTSGTGTFGDASVLSTTYTPSAGDVTAGSVTLTLTANPLSPCGSPAVSNANLTIQGSPTASAGFDSTICENSAIALNGAATNAASVSWSTTGDGSFTAPNSVNTNYYPGPGDISLGSVTLTLTASAILPCTGNASDSMILTIDGLPSVDVGPDHAVCLPNTVNLNGVSNNSSSCLWTTSGDGSFANATSAVTTYTPGPNDIALELVTLTLTCQGSGQCSMSSAFDSVNITLHSSPSIAPQPAGGTVGQGGMFTFTIGASGGGLSYQWYKAPATALTNAGNISGAQSPSLVINPATLGDSGMYYCVVSNNCGSQQSNNATLVVNNQATVSLDPPPGCINGSQLIVTIDLSGASSIIVGGQFFLAYNNTVLDFVSADPGDAPFTREIYEDVNESLGTIDYAVGIPDGGTGTSSNTTMARLTFYILQDVCTLTPNLVTWRAGGPNGSVSKLSDDNGDEVVINPNNLTAIKIDNTGPSITCPPNVTVSCASMIPANDFAGGTVSDNCCLSSVVWVSDDISNSVCANRYTITRTYQATDCCGNVSTCTQIITVDDETVPSITCPPDVTVSCTSMIPANDFAGGSASDNCGGTPTVTWIDDAVTDSICANRYTITRTYQATDACGNSATCAQTITVDDEIAPTITCPPAVTVSCANQVPAANFAGGFASDNCGGTPTITHVGDAITSMTCANRYTITRTYKATDACGNFATCSQTITVNDTTPPSIICPANVTVSCASMVPDADFVGGTASDNCGGAPVVTHVGDAITNVICANRYTITRTYEATDACGLVSTCDQIITVDDETPPSITCPADITVSCTSMIPANDFTGGSASDICGGTPVVAWVADVVTNGTCANRYTLTRTYKATDACGNVATCDQIITVDDETPPSITCPANLTVSCASMVPANDFTGGSASDNCGGTPSVVWLSDVVTNMTCANRYTLTRTYKATDACGNVATCDQIITVDDETAPSITCPPNVTVSCTSMVPANDFTGGTASDNCGGTPTVTHVGDAITNMTCANHYTITRTYKATDACGNEATCDQIITVNDLTNPVITVCPSDINVHAAAGSCNSAPVTYSGSATDNCGGTPAITFSPPSGSTFPQGSTLVTMTATDACGNFSTCTFHVINDGLSEMAVTVELGGGVMANGSFNRCITFELWNTTVNSVAPLYTIGQPMTFSGNNPTPKTATAVLLVPCQSLGYTCITARDRLHTLRRTIDPLPVSGPQYLASFTGAKKLIGGNLNDDKFIDILDFGIYSLQDLTIAPGGASTTCGQVPPFRHADITGNGIVNSLDFSFISNNFLSVRETNCNGGSTLASGGGEGDAPITRISLAELRQRGLGDLAIMDLNHDRVLDVADMALWMAGVRPEGLTHNLQSNDSGAVGSGQ